MGLERHIFCVYIGSSELLNKRWVVRAKDVDDATGKVVSSCSAELSRLEQLSEDGNVNLDLSFTEMIDNVLEL